MCKCKGRKGDCVKIRVSFEKKGNLAGYRFCLSGSLELSQPLHTEDSDRISKLYGNFKK